MPPELSAIVADLCVRIQALESLRRRCLLDWLHQHHRTEQAPTLATLPAYLNTWLGSLSGKGLQWEAQLLLDEITWWRNLPADRLWRMLEAQAAE